jgi:Mg/Co/Ni transporter MgtE
MANAEINSQFLQSTDSATRDSVLNAIAEHYGISAAEALEEVTEGDCEHLLEYLTGSTRSAVSVLMQRRQLSFR